MFFTKSELWYFIWSVIIASLLCCAGVFGSELDDIIKKENLILPPEAQEIVKNNKLVPVMACRYPNQAGIEKIIVIDYLTEEDSQKLFLNNCEKPNFKATAIFDTQKKIIVFCFIDEWGKKYFIRKAFL